jgi:NADH:ubiquinone oxidoreductase subunit 4 (subunit M)
LYADNSFALLVSLIGTVLAVAYNLWMYVRIFFGFMSKNSFIRAYSDLNEREFFLLSFLLIIMLCNGGLS